MGRTIRLTASDGATIDAYRADPAGTPRGGLVVLQEIFGVNPHIRRVADGFAARGYLAVAPALFDRARPGVELGYAPGDIPLGVALIGQVGHDKTMRDVAAVRAALPGVPVFTYPAGHGFNCDARGSYHAASAAEALGRTLAFLAENVG